MLLEQNEGHIVNTASVAGLINPPGMGAYNVSKHAVVSLTETLFHDLAARQSKVGCSVLCPAYVPTGIANSARNRPANLQPTPAEQSAETKAREAMLQKAVRSGKLSADDIAQHVLKAVRDNRFWILTHPKIKGAIAARLEDVMQEQAPRNPLAL
jgi:short-subunit dehydrogenase